jgi:Protein of unknown function (DUF3443)
MQTLTSLLTTSVVLICATLSGCGGGGGSGAVSSSAPAAAASAPAVATPAQPAMDPNLPAPTDTKVTQSTTPNVQTISVGPIATNTRNMLQTSVTICVPGTATCQTIDNIQVDTGSQGLRILASALSPAIAPPAVSTSSGTTAAACSVFGSVYTWGSVRSADIRLAGLVAPATSVQVIADTAVPAVAADCGKSGLPMLTATSLRSNGILGVGPFSADCGSGCTNTALPRWYYDCANGTCTSTTLAVANQITNPVSRFATDNNGVVIELPAIADTGAPSVTGTMTFGIGSQSNNLLGNAQVLPGNSLNGFVTTTFEGQTFNNSYIDSGSNGLFFASATLPRCGFWFCPGTTQTLTATISGKSGATSNVTLSIGNATSLFATGNNAFNNLSGTAGNSFGWGLPFFFGRRIFTAIEAQVTPAGNGPYYAF